jgi:quercetin dioxygenase-like cupin family protein
MIALAPDQLQFSDSYIERDETARWRSAPGHSPSTGARSSGSSVIEVPAGCRLPRHSDSAEEVVVIVAGAAKVVVGDDRHEVHAGGVALVPQDVPTRFAMPAASRCASSPSTPPPTWSRAMRRRSSRTVAVNVTP